MPYLKETDLLGDAKMHRLIAAIVAIFLGGFALAGLPSVTLTSIDGGTLEFADWDGRPVLVVNTASQCAYTRQYTELQNLYDTYRARGLVVLAVPSDDFNQELDSAEEVAAFCEMTYGIDMPMADITKVRGRNAHPLYHAIKEQTGFEPRWNFSKVLFAPDGTVAGTWGSRVAPMDRAIVDAVESALRQLD